MLLRRHKREQKLKEMIANRKPVEESDMTGQQIEPESEKVYTKTEINRMSTADLKELAINTGVEGANSMTGAELKTYLINLFGL